MNGWGSYEYTEAIDRCFSRIKDLKERIPDDYRIIITADHGGHAYNHGSDDPLDMTIPIYFDSRLGVAEEKAKRSSIMDIAPTICSILGVEIPESFDGRTLAE